MLRLYNVALAPLRAGVALWSSLPRREEAKRREWAERRARVLPAIRPGGFWLHGSSVGEIRVLAGLARAVRAIEPARPLAASAFTPAGRERLPEPPDVDAGFFAPLDFPGLPTRMLRALRPSALALVETELWPNLLREAAASGVPVVVLNGRLSERRMSRYRRLARLYRPLLGALSRVGAQSEEDASRFTELGVAANLVRVTGNVKYDLPAPDVDVEALRRRLHLAADSPVFAAGSTGPGEETAVLRAFRRGREDHPRLKLLLAPRHSQRLREVEQEVRADGWTLGRISRTEELAARPDVLLVDTLGELAALYLVAAAAFVGGSLIPLGGHNVLEPAAGAIPVLFGPHTDSVVEPAERLERSGGALRVRDAEDLGTSLSRLLGDASLRAEMGRKARAVVEANRGALQRNVALLIACAASRGAA